MAEWTLNSESEDIRSGHAIEGFESIAAATLAVTADQGLIDGVNKPAVAVTAVVASATFKAFLVSEDGDGT